MKIKILCILLTGGLLALAAWLVHVPNTVQADKIPEKYSDTVTKGLEYLVKNQFKDGHWEGDNGQHPVAMTGLVGLALIMEGSTPLPTGSRPDPVRSAKYNAQVLKAADWLMSKSQARRDGLIFSEHPSETARYMQGHGLATLFLTGVSRERMARREKLSAILAGAVKYIVKAQSTQGGWYHTSKVEGHDFDEIAATAIQIQALQAAENAGIPVPSETIKDAQGYLRNAVAKLEKGAKPWQGQRVDMAATFSCLSAFPPANVGTSGFYAKCLAYCERDIPVGRAMRFGRDELAHCFYAQALFDLGGEKWTNYRKATFDHLQSSQNKDGSWPAADGLGVGPVYATALWCIILQLDNRSHPLRARRPVITEITTYGIFGEPGA